MSERDGTNGSQADDESSDQPPVDGPGGAAGNDEAGGSSYDEPGEGGK